MWGLLPGGFPPTCRASTKGRITRIRERFDPNHYLDCELIILIAAIITKLIGERLPTASAVAHPENELRVRVAFWVIRTTGLCLLGNGLPFEG